MNNGTKCVWIMTIFFLKFSKICTYCTQNIVYVVLLPLWTTYISTPFHHWSANLKGKNVRGILLKTFQVVKIILIFRQLHGLPRSYKSYYFSVSYMVCPSHIIFPSVTWFAQVIQIIFFSVSYTVGPSRTNCIIFPSITWLARRVPHIC